ncbi:hypothetical protein [Dryocola sp. BD613]|uniref:hypothetical protein n=1 Tax=Dryocola sp. BD613 TaxID=3133272 RepID=UPI003F4FECCD
MANQVKREMPTGSRLQPGKNRAAAIWRQRQLLQKKSGLAQRVISPGNGLSSFLLKKLTLSRNIE